MADAETMKKLRKKRRKSNQCTRCGKKVEDKEKNICSDCRKYLRYYKRHNEPPAKKLKVVNRSPVNEVKNKRLVDAMKKKAEKKTLKLILKD